MMYNETELYCVPSTLHGKRISVYQLATWKNGLPFRKIDFSDKGKPIIKIAELNGGITASTSYTEHEYSRDVFLTKGDLVFSWSGNPDTSIDVYRYSLPDGWLNQHIFKVTANRNFVSADYLYYILKFLKPNFSMIAKNKQTTGLGHVTIADLQRMSVIVPSFECQDKISGILKAIDDKIENNNAINHNLLQQAKAIFAKRFIDLESIPNGWKQGNLLDIANYLNGLAMQKYRPNRDESGLPVLKIKELRQGFCDGNSELCSPNIKPEYVIHDGDVIFSWSGSLLVDIWCGGVCGLNQHLFKVTSQTYDKWFYYLWTAHHLERFISIAADKATTMGHIKRGELEKAEVLIPSEKDYKEISSLMNPLFNLIVANRIEARKLAELRDELLPKLMSGEIDVSEVSV